MRYILSTILAALAFTAQAATTEIRTARYVGGFQLKSPVVLDSLNNKQEKYSDDKLIDTPLSLNAASKAPAHDLSTLLLQKGTLNLLSFYVTAQSHVSSEIKVAGAKHYKVFADGSEVKGKATMEPGQHTISVKFIADSTGIGVSIDDKSLTIDRPDAKMAFGMQQNLGTRVTSGASLSPSGRWAIVTYRWYDAKNATASETMLCDLKTGQKRELEKNAQWMPLSDLYYYKEKEDGKTALKAADPLTGAIRTLATGLSDASVTIAPTEDYIILTEYVEGPKKEDGVFEIVHPDDRQPNWRSRSSISKMDLKTGFVQPLINTYHQHYVYDISADGKHILLGVSTDSLTQRPTTRMTFYDFNIETMQMRTLVEKDGFINGAMWAQNTDYVLFYGGTEMFNGIGKRLPEGRTPNMYDYHLYVMDSKTLKVTPVTADDKTSIESMVYSPADGNVYYTAQNADSVSLYRLSLKTLASTRVPQPLEVLNGIDVASKGGNIIVHGSSATVPYRVYNITAPAAKAKSSLVLDPNAELYANVQLGTCHPWSFQSSRGDKVTGHYYLPANFDSSKKYPVIVHYYGGCSPTSRRFGGGSHYPSHYWNALGYIVFIVNPSGASGFGQEWASRHVNTMGEGPAQDIIDATRQFISDVPQVDADRIGCVSASYGGFMTQYMLTKDNPFACGISHAGISDHTSYWGEGYWGYSYSEVSAANSYPWTRKDLYVDRSPLFNADKIKKPLLFTHGTADTNVPIGESIQMYTALKLLGTPTAFIQVEGENHGIMDPGKRTKWINSMLAWFQKYLKDDPTWWDAIYKPKSL